MRAASVELNNPHKDNDSNGDTTLFRREALEHYLRETEGKDVLKVSPPWTWLLLWIFGSLVTTALLLSIFGRMEINERGRGILRPASGVRMLNAQSGGVVAEILAPSGTTVQAGQPILRIDSAQIQGAALEAQTLLSARLQGYQPVIKSQDQLFEQQITTAKQRLSQTQDDIQRCGETLNRAKSMLDNMNKYKADQIYSKLDYNREEENKASAERQLANAQLSHRQANQELVNLQSQRKTQVWRDTTDLESAKARANAVGLTERQTYVIAPVTGLVDGLVLKPGDPVQPGQLMAKLIPKDSPLVVVAFLQEKDRAFVKDGDSVQLELNQYSYSEFGTLRGCIRSVAADLASPAELQEAFGASPTQNTEGPSFRVEVELVDDLKALEARNIRLRPGMLLSARFTLRRQSLITFAIDPLRKWLN